MKAVTPECIIRDGWRRNCCTPAIRSFWTHQMTERKWGQWRTLLAVTWMGQTQDQNYWMLQQLQGRRNSSNIHKAQGKESWYFPPLAFCWVMWQAGTDAAHLRKLKRENQTEFNKRPNIVIAIWGLLICILYDILWTHIFLFVCNFYWQLHYKSCHDSAWHAAFAQWEDVANGLLFCLAGNYWGFQDQMRKQLFSLRFYWKRWVIFLGRGSSHSKKSLLYASWVHFCSQEHLHHMLQGCQLSC